MFPLNTFSLPFLTFCYTYFPPWRPELESRSLRPGPRPHVPLKHRVFLPFFDLWLHLFSPQAQGLGLWILRWNPKSRILGPAAWIQDARPTVQNGVRERLCQRKGPCTLRPPTVELGEGTCTFCKTTQIPCTLKTTSFTFFDILLHLFSENTRHVSFPNSSQNLNRVRGPCRNSKPNARPAPARTQQPTRGAQPSPLPPALARARGPGPRPGPVGLGFGLAQWAGPWPWPRPGTSLGPRTRNLLSAVG